MIKKVNIVVFDFDGTLSASDSNLEFGKYCFKHSIRPWLYLPKMLVSWFGKTLNPGGIWWRQNMRSFLTPDMIREFKPGFIREHKRRRFDWAKDAVKREKKMGNKVLLISASPNYLIPELVSDIDFDAIYTSKMDANQPWKYDFLCWGSNKVLMLDEWAKKHKYIPNVVRAYSDSKSDMPIMQIAEEQIWIDKKTGKRKK